MRYPKLLLTFAALWFVAGCTTTSTTPESAASTPTGAVPNGQFNVRSFGAKGDGVALDTAAINQAIEAAATAGGGAVVFPAGNYLSFSIHLKSHVALHLDMGATILAAEPPA